MVDEKNITPNDLVAYYGEDGGYKSAGYLISSVFDGGKLPPIVTINNKSVKGAASLQTGGKAKKDKPSDLFKGLALPLGLLALGSAGSGGAELADEEYGDSSNEYGESSTMEGGKKQREQVSVIPHTIYDRLLALVEEDKKEKKSRKTKRKYNKQPSDIKKVKKGRKTRKN